MRKTRKGAADVPAAPSPSPSPPIIEEQQPKRLCMQCMQRDAVLWSSRHEDPLGAVFCTMNCAMVFAMTIVATKKYRWCEDHLEWSDHRGRCVSCSMAKQGYEKHLYNNQVQYHTASDKEGRS